MKNLVIPLDTCVECGSKENIVMHHVIPESRGGKFMIPVCQLCHDKVHGLKERNISLVQLTKDGMAKAKARGVKFGTPNPEKATKAMVKANKDKKLKFSQMIYPEIQRIKSNGITTLRGIAAYLNENTVPTRTGRKWYPATIRNIIRTYEETIRIS